MLEISVFLLLLSMREERPRKDNPVIRAILQGCQTFCSHSLTAASDLDALFLCQLGLNILHGGCDP